METLLIKFNPPCLCRSHHEVADDEEEKLMVRVSPSRKPTSPSSSSSHALRIPSLVPVDRFLSTDTW